MIYSISSISNRDVQLLYHYRMLKQPSDYLNEVFRGESIFVQFPSIGQLSSRQTDNQVLYEYSTELDVPENRIPMLEFTGNESDWAQIQYLTEAEVNSNRITLYSTNQSLGETVRVNVYWCQSFESITKALLSHIEDIEKLSKELDNLKLEIDSLSLGDEYLKNPEGIRDNLVKFEVTDEGRVTLADSKHRIVGATESQTLMNPSQEELSGLIKHLGGPIKIEGSSSEPRILENFSGHNIKITGSGTWIFLNISSTIILENFSGSFFANQCTHIRTYGSYNRIKEAQIVQSFLTHRTGLIEKLKLARQSAVKHMGDAKIKTLEQVGIACEYYSQVSYSRYEPDFEWDTIQGTVNLISGLIVHNGFEVSYQTGHHDDPLPAVISGSASTPTQPSGIPGWTPAEDTSTSGIEGWYCDGYHTYTVYEQWCGPWANYPYWDNVISTDGCGPCAAACVISGYGSQPTPQQTADDLVQLHLPSAVYGGWQQEADCLRKYGLQTSDAHHGNREEIVQNLKEHRPVIITIAGAYRPGAYSKAGHFLALLDYNEATDEVFLGDSGSASGWFPLQGIIDTHSSTNSSCVLVTS